MSFGFGVTDFITVVNLSNKLRKRFVDSPSEFRAISEELNALSRVIRDLLADSAFAERELSHQQKADLKSHILACENLLADLEKVLDKYHGLENAIPIGRPRKSRRLWDKITWDPADINQFRLRLASNMAQLNAFTNQRILEVSYATKAGVRKLESHKDNETHREMLEWLSPTNFAAYQSDILGSCQEDTGQWFLQSPEFQTWLNGQGGTHFCTGIPGAGKTAMTSILIDYLQNRFSADSQVGIAFLYFNYRRPAEQTIENSMANLLKQVVQSRPDLRSEVNDIHQRHCTKGSRPTVTELSDTLKVTTDKFSKFYLVIDALDECLQRQNIAKLLSEISGLRRHQSVALLATSGSIPEILKLFTNHPVMEIRAQDEDVCRYLENQMTILPSSVRRNSALRETIKTSISAAVKGISQKPGFERLARDTLSWLVYAQRELSIKELRYALAIEEDTTDLDEDNLEEADEIISSCGGLVVYDIETDIVRLVHYTTQECLERVLLDWAPLAQETITKACLTYSSFHAIQESCREYMQYDYSWFRYMNDRYHEYPFLSYAAYHWISHARRSWNERVEEMVAIWFLDEQTIASSLEVFLRHVEGLSSFIPPEKPTVLHLAALLGLDTIVARFLSQGWSPNCRNGRKNTPLFYASFHHPSVGAGDKEAVVRQFFKRRETDVNARNEENQTPLHKALQLGEETMAELLLSHVDIQINVRDEGGNTPLTGAVLGKNENIVRKLVNRKALQVNMQGERGFTALNLAISVRSYVIGRILLQRDDIRVNLVNNMGFAAIHTLAIASRFEGHDEDFSTLLLEREDVLLNEKNDHHNPPLALGAFVGSANLVKLLIQRKSIDVIIRGPRERTALMIAAKEGHTDVVRMLLEEAHAEIAYRDIKGKTALMLGYESGYEDLVTLLEQAGVPGEIPEPKKRFFIRRSQQR